MIYENFAKVYDQLMYDFNYDAVYNFLEQILSINNISVKKILEMACGTGSMTEKFARTYYIDAFDVSEQMLSCAEEKLRGSKARLFCQDMRSFHPMDSYNVVLCLCDSFNYLTQEAELRQVFSQVYDCMEESGIFIFDLNTKEKFKNMEQVYVDEVEDVVYIWENEYDESTQTNLYGVNFFCEQKDGLYERWYEEHTERAYDIDTVIQFLNEAGFSEITVYNGYTFDKKVDTAFRHVYVVKK